MARRIARAPRADDNLVYDLTDLGDGHVVRVVAGCLCFALGIAGRAGHGFAAGFRAAVVGPAGVGSVEGVVA